MNLNRNAAILRASAAVAVVLICGSIAVQARAADFEAHAVSTAGLDLSAPSGQAMLRHRITVAANRLCVHVVGVEFSDAWLECRREAINTARGDVDRLIAAAVKQSRLAALSSGAH